MKSDFKHIVKESLREAFYPRRARKLPTFKIVILGELYYAVISKNTKLGERPYKITFFKRDKDTQKLLPVPKETHWKIDGKENSWDIDWEEMEYMLKNKKLPDRFTQGYQGRYKGKVDPPEIVFQEQSLNEILLFLENSARELELYIENKQPA